jgi:hypothetical protein
VKLLTSSNYKTMKGEKFGYKTFILHLAPSNLSGNNTCPSASIGCAAACLNTAGLGNCNSVQTARIRKTQYFYEDREAFMQDLEKDIRSGITNARNKEMTPTFRLNGTSDIRWEEIRYKSKTDDDELSIFERFPDIQFYDYTKIPTRGRKGPLPSNYQLVFSRSEENERFVNDAMRRGQNVAVVFGVPPGLPETWRGWPVIDGDKSDLRFLDPPRSVVGLTAKGRGKQDTTGFIVYGSGVIDIENLAEWKKKAAKDKSIMGERQIAGETFVPVQSKVSKAAATRTAELIRSSGRNARIVEHNPMVAGRRRKAFAVYTPGEYSRTRHGALRAIHIRAPSRLPRMHY